MKIALSQNKCAIIDFEDFERIMGYTWCYHHGYVVTHSSRKSEQKGKLLYLHRVIMNPGNDKVVDHINGDPLDNRKSNLRICDHSGNMRNCKKPKHNTSGYKGVSFDKKAKKWRAYIKAEGKQIHLGFFETPEKAAKAYEVASKKYHKEFGRTT